LILLSEAAAGSLFVFYLIDTAAAILPPQKRCNRLETIRRAYLNTADIQFDNQYTAKQQFDVSIVLFYTPLLK